MAFTECRRRSGLAGRGRQMAARDRGGGGDRALLGEGLVVLLDLVEVVEVVDHQAVRLRAGPSARRRRGSSAARAGRRCRGGSGRPDRRAAARRPWPSGSSRPRPGSARRARLSAFSGSSLPAGLVEERERRPGARRRGTRTASASRSRSSQAAKPGTGERVTKVFRFGSSRFRSSTTCLIRKLPKETPRRPFWLLRDRVEHGGRRLRPQRSARGLRSSSGRDRCRDLLGQRHLDEDQRLVDQLRVEEAEAAAVGRLRGGCAGRPSPGSRAPPRSG